MYVELKCFWMDLIEIEKVHIIVLLFLFATAL